MSDFKALIEKERERLTKLAEDYHAQIADLQGKLDEVHQEMRAITAYEELGNTHRSAEEVARGRLGTIERVAGGGLK